uniref:Uncharacterized protein n=1 Tax=Leptocylindrus danicus TaxID=163516 RepID=A0A7S2K251_9STRA
MSKNSRDITSLIGPTSKLYNLILMKSPWGAIKSRAEQHPGDLFWKNSYGMMPIHIACCMQPPVEVIRAMLTGTKSVGKLDCSSKGNIPLHFACLKAASYDVLKLLLWVSVCGTVSPFSNAGQRNIDNLSPLDLLLDFYLHKWEGFEQEFETAANPHTFSALMQQFWLKATLLLRALFLHDTGTLPDTLPHFSPLLIQQSLFAVSRFDVPEKMKRLVERVFLHHVEKYPSICKILDRQGRFLLNKVILNHVRWDSEILHLIINTAPKVLEVRDKQAHLYPFMLAAVSSNNASDTCVSQADFRQLETIYHILRASPSKVVSGTSVDKDHSVAVEIQTKKRARRSDDIGIVEDEESSSSKNLTSVKKREKKKSRLVSP